MIGPAFTIGTGAGEVPLRATGVIVIDVARVRANWSALAQRVAPAECAAVVKADAYGLGAAKIIPALFAEGCRTFFVATADEAEEARRLLSPQTVIYVLDGNLDDEIMRWADARPVLGDIGEIQNWATTCRKLGQRLPAAVQVDSGLHRRGISVAQIERLMTEPALFPAFDMSLVMSHLACADDPDNAMNAKQRDAFELGRRLLPSAPASLAASDGLMLGPAYHFDLVRPGYAIYGGQAFQGGPAPVEPVVRAYARILQVRDVAKGAAVGYSATWTTAEPRRIATIAAGYADGVFRHASAATGQPGGMVAIGGTLCPIVGRVSMDLVTADVTSCPQAAAHPHEAGGWAELIGPHLTIEDVGAHAGTIGYEVLTRLSRRFHRIYQGE